MKLRYLADIRSIAFVATYFGLVVAQWFFVPTNPFIAVPVFVATCIFSWVGAVITHNSIHCPVFSGARSNRVFQIILSLTYGSAVSAFVPGHNLSHHKHTQTNRDVMRTSKARSQWNIVNLMVFAPRVAISIMRNDAAYVKAMKGQHRSWFRQYMVETYAVIGVTGLLFIIDWKKAAAYWLIPHLYAAWGIISINFLQHDGCDQNHPFNHSRNFVGRTLNWFTFNNGYHGIHHEKPSLHWSLLREAHDEYLGPHIHPELDQKSLIIYVLKTFVFPGRRRRYDGGQVQLDPDSRDENWIPNPKENPEDLGALAA
jgi:fatty acid desaturase